MNEIKISVVICAYNASAYIRQALDSVVNQRYPMNGVEIVLVDDGSTDDTADIIKNQYGTRVKYFYRENGGHTAALNTGLEHVSGEYIFFIDADDYWEEDKMREVMSVFDGDKNVDVVYNWVRLVNGARETVGYQPDEHNTNKDYLSDDYLREYLAGRIPYTPPTSGIAVKKECLDKLGPLSEIIPFPDCIMRYLLPLYAKRIVAVKKYLHNYRLHADNTWANKEQSEQTLRRDISTYENLGTLVKKHAKATGHDSRLMELRIKREIARYRILLLKNTGNRFAAFRLAVVSNFPVFDRHRFEKLYWVYAKINMLIGALLPDTAYNKLYRLYRESNLFKIIHVFWAK